MVKLGVPAVFWPVAVSVMLAGEFVPVLLILNTCSDGVSLTVFALLPGTPSWMVARTTLLAKRSPLLMMLAETISVLPCMFA